jgi:predicted small metal-binding protein
MKTLRCRDIGFDCDQEIHAETEDEVLQQAAEHAQSVHNVSVTPEIAEQVRAHIHDEEATRP